MMAMIVRPCSHAANVYYHLDTKYSILSSQNVNVNGNSHKTQLRFRMLNHKKKL